MKLNSWTSVLIFSFVTLALTPACAQVELRVGDRAPDYTFPNVYNFNKPSLSLSGLEDKLVILDFWNSSCVTCIDSWAKLHALQEKFGDKIMLLLVNEKQDSAKIGSLYRKWEKQHQRKMLLPSAYSDKTITKYFPVTSVPHIVWINQGIVRSITGGDVLNEKTIDAFLAGTPRKLMQKTNERYHVDLKRPIFVDGNGPFKAEVKWQSIFSGYSPGMIGGTAWRSTDTLSYFAAVNFPIITLPRVLFGIEWVNPYNPRFLQVARVELRVKDSSKFLLYVDGETRYDNVLTYHFWARKKVSFEEMKSILITEVKRFYGIDFKWEKQVKECLVLATVDSSKYTYRGGEQFIGGNDQMARWCNITTDDIVYDFLASGNYHDSPWPIVNETGYKGKVRLIEVNCKMNDYKALDRELRKHGMSLSLQKREVDVLVITDHEVL